MKKWFRYGAFIVSIILFISSAILLADIPKVDDIPISKVIRENVSVLSDFDDMDNNDAAVSFCGASVAYSGVDLTAGQSLIVKYTLNNPSQERITVFTDLYNYDENYDSPLAEVRTVIEPGVGTYESEIAFYRHAHPDSASLRFFSSSDSCFIEITDIEVSIAEKVKDENKAVAVLTVLDAIVLVLSIAYIVGYIAVNFKSFDKSIFEKTKLRDGFLLYGAVILTVTALLALLYRNADLSRPVVLENGDDLGVFYYVKTIAENGFSMVNPREGGITGADMYDYPFSDKLSFITVKLLSLFSDNVYLITNLFYFSSYMLIALVSCRVCRSLGCGKRISYLIAVVYAFSPYIQMRFAHMWLTPYYTLPVACMISIRILNDEIDTKSNRYWTYVLLAFGCAFTGLYYAWFSCAVMAAAIAIKLFSSKKKDILDVLKHCAYIISCAVGVIVNMMPNMIYWMINGFCSKSEIFIRSGADTDVYGLRLIQMLLPRMEHRIDLFARAANKYAANYPLINENTTSSVGIIAAVGMAFALIDLLCKRKPLAESKLIFSVFIIGTMGGIGTMLSFVVSLPVRSYNRMSLLIMFMSLLIAGRYLSQVIDKLPKAAGTLAVCAITGLGIFDQTVAYVQPDYTSFQASRRFVHQIEDTLDAGDMVFVLPVLDWPSQGGYLNHMGYLESKELIWSYGAAQGREESVWQHTVASFEPSQMLSEMRYAGYEGIYFDILNYGQWYGAEAASAMTDGITAAAGVQPMISDDGRLYFWDIRQ